MTPVDCATSRTNSMSGTVACRRPLRGMTSEHSVSDVRRLLYDIAYVLKLTQQVRSEIECENAYSWSTASHLPLQECYASSSH
ncbi:MAG: hypothetical protein NZU63_05460 [Gemmataceae bacterium]|nr:hypothetical protein [Gemmataceae bacterium]